MSGIDLSEAAWFVRGLASEEAHAAAARFVDPAHLLIALCRLSDMQRADLVDLDPEVADGLAAEAAALRSRFARAGLDPVALRRRVRRSGGVNPLPPSRTPLQHNSACHAVFDRAEALADTSAAPHVDTQHLLRAVLEAPVPEWAVAAADLGVDDPLVACFPADDPADDAPAGAARVCLDVTDGRTPHRRIVLTARARVVVGRASDCTLRITDDDAKVVSRHQCLIDVNPPEACVRDLGSRNGTFVNGTRLAQPDDGPGQVLRDGDVVSFGDAEVRISITAPAPATLVVPAPTRIRHSTTLVAPSTLVLRRCPVCGTEITPADGQLCVPCGRDPDRMARVLAERVDAGAEPGGVFGGFTLRRRLGSGGMGAVYLADDEQTREPVALKIMLPQVPGLEKAEEMFLREATNAKLLRHRHIVRQREHGRWHGAYYIAMDYCDGGDVAALLHRSGGRLTARRATRIAIQTLEALEYAHGVEVPVRLPGDRIMVATGLVHRDISPGNLLFSRGMVKLADFGLSKAFDAAGLSGITRSGTAAGKPRFVPRQQVLDYRRATPAVDVWSVAACLYYMLTGQPPRDFTAVAGEWAVVLETGAVPVRERDRSVPAALAHVVDRALVDEPAIGYRTARELREALLAVLPAVTARGR